MYDLAPNKEPENVSDWPNIQSTESCTSPAGSRKNAVIVSNQPRNSVAIAVLTFTLSIFMMFVVGGCAWFRALPRGVFYLFMENSASYVKRSFRVVVAVGSLGMLSALAVLV